MSEPKHYSDEEIEKLTSFKVEITPEEWLRDFNSLGRANTADEYAIIYGYDFMAHAPAIIRQLRAERDEARLELDTMKALNLTAIRVVDCALVERQTQAQTIREMEERN